MHKNLKRMINTNQISNKASLSLSSTSFLSERYRVLLKNLVLRKRIPLRTIIEFTKSTAVLINAKIPFVKALETISSQITNNHMKRLIFEIKTNVEKGKDFSTSIEIYPYIFDQLYVQLVKIGESSSNLGLVLSWQANYLEKLYYLRKKILLALIYPSLLVSCSILAISFFLVFIFPAVAEIFTDFGAQLPWGIIQVLKFSSLLPHIFSGILLILGVYLITAHATGYWLKIKRKLDRIIVSTPFFGKILKQIFVSRFCRSLGLLVKSGNPLSNSLSVCVSITSNSYIRDLLTPCLSDINMGKGLSNSLRKTTMFPDMVCELLLMGESTAELDEILVYIADFYEKDLDALADTITSIIEPVIIVGVGIFIAFIVICLYIPLFDMVDIINY